MRRNAFPRAMGGARYVHVWDVHALVAMVAGAVPLATGGVCVASMVIVLLVS